MSQRILRAEIIPGQPQQPASKITRLRICVCCHGRIEPPAPYIHIATGPQPDICWTCASDIWETFHQEILKARDRG